MKLVNVKTERCTHYIGRRSSYYGLYKHGYFADLGNPFGMKQPWGKKDLRQQVVDSFEEYARARPEVMEKIKALPEDAVLGCWCAPAKCHGEIIIKLWEELHGKTNRTRS